MCLCGRDRADVNLMTNAPSAGNRLEGFTPQD